MAESKTNRSADSAGVQALRRALADHQAGRLDQAAERYRQILQTPPDGPATPVRADALHLLGVVSYQKGQFAQAEELIAQAVRLNPAVAAYHGNLGEVCRAAGGPDKTAQALRHLRRALQLDPNYADAWNNLALVHQAAGQLAEAADALRRAIQIRPGYAMAHNNLGNVLRLRNDLPGAIEQFRQAAQLAPDHAEAHSNLGQALLEANQPEQAEPHCRRAVALRPDLAEAHSNLGNVLRALGRLPEAKAAYAQALRLRPDIAMIHNNIGQALQEEGQLAEAVRWYRQAIQRAPRTARFHCNLASVLEDQADLAAAEAALRHAIRLEPDYAEAHVGLGRVLQDLGRPDQALACFDQAIGLRPALASAHVNRAHLLAELGQLEPAVAGLRQALGHDPRSTEAYSELALTLGDKLAPEDADAIERLLAQGNLPDRRREMMHAGLAAYLDATARYPAAAEHAAGANALEKIRRQRKGETYDPADHSRYVDRLIAVFTADWFARLASDRPDDATTRRRDEAPPPDIPAGPPANRSIAGSEGPPAHFPPLPGREGAKGGSSPRAADVAVAAGPLPIFVVGMPRSGTTLIEQMLASHPRAFGAGELPEIRRLIDSLPKRPAAPSADPLDCLAALTSQTAADLGARHRARLGELNAKPSADRVIDKMPDNYLNLGLIAAILPQARIIHCRRDVRDVAVSCWLTSFKSIRWACEPAWIAARIRDYLRLMDHWRRVLPGRVFASTDQPLAVPAPAGPPTAFDPPLPGREGVAPFLPSLPGREGAAPFFSPLPGREGAGGGSSIGQANGALAPTRPLPQGSAPSCQARMLEIDYEQVVADPEAAARRLLDFCGLDFDPACLQFHKTVRQVRTASLRQVRQPVYTRSVARWKNYEKELADLFAAIGPTDVGTADERR